jgi:hypothetical protein
MSEVDGANEYRITLCFMGDDLSLEQATRVVGLNPTFSVRKGETYRPSLPNYKGQEKLAKTTIWEYELTNITSDKGEEVLENFIDGLVAKSIDFKAINFEYCELYFGLSSYSGQMNIFFNEMLLRKITALPASLSVSCFDLYDPKHPYWDEGDNKTRDSDAIR